MIKKLTLKTIIVLFVMITNHLTAQDLLEKTKIIPLGDDVVKLKLYEKHGADLVYVHVHENETTSLAAGIEILQKYGGKLVTLAHSTDTTTNRNVIFNYKSTSYQFDPNRIYTSDESVLKQSISVVKGDGKVTRQVIKMVQGLADNIWKEVVDFPLIVALHNNKNTPAEHKNLWMFWQKYEPESFSITSYIKKFDFSSGSNKSCSDIYINPEINNSEFFIVTERQDFYMMLNKRYSVVLQNENPVDDGSMSVFAAKNQKRYINSEAKHGRLAEQFAMLELIHQK